MIFFILFIPNSKEFVSDSFENNLSKLFLNVKGKGDKIILGHEYDGDKKMFFDSKYYPDEVYINGIKQKQNITYQYNFKEEINEVILIWHHNINNASCMFHGCSNITEIDFTHFNS